MVIHPQFVNISPKSSNVPELRGEGERPILTMSGFWKRLLLKYVPDVKHCRLWWRVRRNLGPVECLTQLCPWARKRWEKARKKLNFNYGTYMTTPTFSFRMWKSFMSKQTKEIKNCIFLNLKLSFDFAKVTPCGDMLYLSWYLKVGFYQIQICDVNFYPNDCPDAKIFQFQSYILVKCPCVETCDIWANIAKAKENCPDCWGRT